jgi:hypothetical protein
MTAPTNIRERRALQLLDDAARKLDRVQRGTDHQPTLVLARRYREMVRSHKRVLTDPAHAAFRDADASHTLATFGPNGLLPAIDSLMASARCHGARTPVLEAVR